MRRSAVEIGRPRLWLPFITNPVANFLSDSTQKHLFLQFAEVRLAAMLDYALLLHVVVVAFRNVFWKSFDKEGPLECHFPLHATCQKA